MKLHSYSWTGPISYHSMLAQIMLRYGLRQVAVNGDVQIEFIKSNNSIDVLLELTNGKIFRFENLPSRTIAGRCIQDAMNEITGQDIGTWGYLIGMRPSKLLHRFFSDADYEEKAREFLDAARVNSDWRELLVRIGNIQKKYIPHDGTAAHRRTLVYIGIPFCPSHCVYCSFPARLARPNEDWEGFVRLLIEDIRNAGQLVEENNLQVDSVYYGGGTPTVLPERYFDKLLTAVKRYIIPHITPEYTVEAGRPDTITKTKLESMIRHGVNRISVNPQTLQESLLRKIGRGHDVRRFEMIYRLVREYPFKAVNMDFIAGLPGQTIDDMEENITRVLALQPENITVHTLALKRHSPLAVSRQREMIPSTAITERMVRSALEEFTSGGYSPYYIYRQKYMAADLANIGYALPGTESEYNIQMMGERVHVLGIGPGATTRVIQNKHFQLRRFVMSWDPEIYKERRKEYFRKRRQLFTEIRYKGESIDD